MSAALRQRCGFALFVVLQIFAANANKKAPSSPSSLSSNPLLAALLVNGAPIYAAPGAFEQSAHKEGVAFPRREFNKPNYGTSSLLSPSISTTSDSVSTPKSLKNVASQTEKKLLVRKRRKSEKEDDARKQAGQARGGRDGNAQQNGKSSDNLSEKKTGQGDENSSQNTTQKSLSEQPGLLAGIIIGVILAVLFLACLAVFCIYRLRKKDEGSYALDEPKKMLMFRGGAGGAAGAVGGGGGAHGDAGRNGAAAGAGGGGGRLATNQQQHLMNSEGGGNRAGEESGYGANAQHLMPNEPVREFYA